MGLPEFILHRMLVPNSFRFERSRFSFEIKNTYAPGTITHLKLIADGSDIPLDQIQYQAEGQPAQLANQISPTRPAPIPTGIRISISLQASTEPKKLVLWAETKEAGIIQFTVKDDNKLAIRKPSIRSFLGKPVDLHLDFDLENSIPVNKQLLGGICPIDPSQNPGDASLIHLPLLVFPPVNASLGSRWSDGIGPLQSRIARHDLGWNPQQENGFGTDEFLHYCETNRIHPMLAVDSTRTSAEDAARWVLYCNISPTSSEGIDRSVNGHEAPFAVKTWIITGNAWQDWELSPISALTYAQKINHFVRAMRAVDHELKIGILVKGITSDDLADQNTRWNELLLKEVGQSIDFVYWQIPILEDGFVSAETPVENITQVQETFQANLEKMISRIRAQISRCIQDRVVLQAIDASRLFDSLDGQIQNKTTRMDQIDSNILLLKTLKSMVKYGDTVTFLTLGPNELQATQLPPMRALFTALTSGVKSSAVPLAISQNSTSADQQPNAPELDAILFSSSSNHQFELILANCAPEQRLRLKLTGPQFSHIRLLRSSRTPSLINAFLPKFRKKGDSYEMNLPPHSITFASFDNSVGKS